MMHEYLSGLTEEEFMHGLNKFIRTQENVFPGTNVIGMIRRFALEDPSEPSAEEGWGQVTAWIHNRKLQFHPLVQKTLEMLGGIEKLKWDLIRDENQETNRAHFYRTYKSVAERERNKTLMGGI